MTMDQTSNGMSRRQINKRFASRAARRSGKVVTYREGEEKPSLPEPTVQQQRQQDRWLR
jgi:hypothetical protein